MSDVSSGGDAVAIVATMDTKRAEVSYVEEIVRRAGRDVILVDVGTGGAAATRAADPAALLAELAEQARKKVGELFTRGKISAVLGIAGGKGSGVFGSVVADLPFGFPKMLVSSARPALLAELGARSDLLLYPTLVDLFGVNGFTRRILDNAGNAIAAVRYERSQQARKKIVAISAFGVTTPAVNACVQLLALSDVEAIVFPANGAGGRKMESLIDAGEFDSVIDVTTTELADELIGGAASAGPERLTAAGRRGIPQVVMPGAVDMVNFGAPSTVPERFSGRTFYSHTPYTTLMRTTPEETREIGRRTGAKLAEARGPVLVLWPKNGVSDYDREGGMFHDPAANVAWLEGLRETLGAQEAIREVSGHINDPQLASIAVTWVVQNMQKEALSYENV